MPSAASNPLAASTSAPAITGTQPPPQAIFELVRTYLRDRSSPGSNTELCFYVSKAKHQLPDALSDRQADFLLRQLRPLSLEDQKVRVEGDATNYIIRVLDPLHEVFAQGVGRHIVTLTDQLFGLDMIIAYGSSTTKATRGLEKLPVQRLGAGTGADGVIPDADQSDCAILCEVAVSQSLLSEASTHEKEGVLNRCAYHLGAPGAQDNLAGVLFAKFSEEVPPSDPGERGRYPRGQGGLATRYSDGVDGLLPPIRRIHLDGVDMVLSSLFGDHPVLQALPDLATPLAQALSVGTAAQYNLSPPQPLLAATQPHQRDSWNYESNTGPAVRFLKWHFCGPKARRNETVPGGNPHAPVDLTSATMERILRNAARAQRNFKQKNNLL